jgi:hypothetical protein
LHSKLFVAQFSPTWLVKLEGIEYREIIEMEEHLFRPIIGYIRRLMSTTGWHGHFSRHITRVYYIDPRCEILWHFLHHLENSHWLKKGVCLRGCILPFWLSNTWTLSCHARWTKCLLFQFQVFWTEICRHLLSIVADYQTTLATVDIIIVLSKLFFNFLLNLYLIVRLLSYFCTYLLQLIQRRYNPISGEF